MRFQRSTAIATPMPPPMHKLKMFTLALMSAAKPSSFAIQPPDAAASEASTVTASSAPTTITEEMALVNEPRVQGRRDAPHHVITDEDGEHED